MEPPLENNKIYVRGLPEEVTENALSEHFEKYGRVLKATVAMDGLTSKPKGFGFVWFADEDSAKAAIGDVEDHVILGTKVEVKEAIRRERSSIQDNEGDESTNCESIRNDLRRGKKMFVGGLPPDLTQEEFKSFFESFGETTDVVIIVDRVSRKSRGFGFVTYESEESARAVLRTSRYLIHGKEVEVKVAIPRQVSNTTTVHPNVHPQGQHHPSAGVIGYHHDSSFRPMYGMIPPYANSAPIYPQGQHHPSAGVNGYHHHSSFRPVYSMFVGPPYANSAPIYPYANGMAATSPAYACGMAATSPAYACGMAATSPAYAYGISATSPAHAVNGFHGYNGYARTASNGNRPAPRPFTKIRISKPPGINGEDSAACSKLASCVEDPSPVSEDSNLDGRPSPSGIYDGKDQASSLENGQNDS